MALLVDAAGSDLFSFPRRPCENSWEPHRGEGILWNEKQRPVLRLGPLRVLCFASLWSVDLAQRHMQAAAPCDSESPFSSDLGVGCSPVPDIPLSRLCVWATVGCGKALSPAPQSPSPGMLHATPGVATEGVHGDQAPPSVARPILKALCVHCSSPMQKSQEDREPAFHSYSG